MGLTRVKVVLHQGYLKIRTTANRKSTYRTLSIPMDSANWNKEAEEVRKSHPESERLNRLIQEELRNHYLYGNIPTKTLHGEPDIVAYFHRVVKNTANPGTRQIKSATLKKFIDFLKYNNLNELRFNDLNAERVNQFYNYLLGEVSVNTAGHHLRQFKSLINRAINEGKVSYLYNPFSTLKMRYVEPQIHGLTELEISQLIQEQNLRKDKHLGAFLFSLFAQGMRKSDMILLRWSNFNYQYEKLYCTFTAKKTKKPTPIILNQMAVLYLEPQLSEYYPKLRSSLKNIHSLINNHRDKAQKLQNFIEKFKTNGDELNREIRKEWLKMTTRDSDNPAFEWSLENLKSNLKIQLTSVREYETEIYTMISVAVNELAVKRPREFVFDYLKGQDISKYHNDNEWKIIDNKAKLYNYHLKKVGNNVGFKNLTPHIARHSYARMLDEFGISIQTIQKLIGHSDPQRTMNYIRRINDNAENNANTILADKFKEVRYHGMPWNHFKD
jgi:integrase